MNIEAEQISNFKKEAAKKLRQVARVAARVPVLGPLVLPLALSGVQYFESASMVAAQDATCSADNSATFFTYNPNNHLSLVSASDGEIWDFGLIDDGVQAVDGTNDLTTALGRINETTPYEWLNIPFQELDRDPISGARRMSDRRVVELFRGQTNTADGAERMQVLQDAITQTFSNQCNRSVLVDWNNAQGFYWSHDGVRNTIGDLNLANLQWLGASDSQIAATGIGFDGDGNTASVEEWQTARRPSEASPNQVIASLDSQAGDNLNLLVETDPEGDINISYDPDATTGFGVRSAEAPDPAFWVPIYDNETGQLVDIGIVFTDGSCGNIISQLTIPFRFRPTQFTVSPTPTETIVQIFISPTPSETPTQIPGPTQLVFIGGGGGGGSSSFPVTFIITATPGETAIPGTTPTAENTATPQGTPAPINSPTAENTATPQGTPAPINSPTAENTATPQATPLRATPTRESTATAQTLNQATRTPAPAATSTPAPASTSTRVPTATPG